jgi:hypothetical protein
MKPLDRYCPADHSRTCALRQFSIRVDEYASQLYRKLVSSCTFLLTWIEASQTGCFCSTCYCQSECEKPLTKLLYLSIKLHAKHRTGSVPLSMTASVARVSLITEGDIAAIYNGHFFRFDARMEMNTGVEPAESRPSGRLRRIILRSLNSWRPVIERNLRQDRELCPL